MSALVRRCTFPIAAALAAAMALSCGGSPTHAAGPGGTLKPTEATLPRPPGAPNRSNAQTFLSTQLLADFDQLWAFVRDHYCFFGDKRVAWERVRDDYRPRAEQMTDRDALLRLVEDLLDELYDPHSHVNDHLPDSRRFPGYDVWAEWRDGPAIITDVRRPSAAYDAGARAGMEVVTIDGVPVVPATQARRPQHLAAPDREADGWALLSLLSGRLGTPRRLQLRDRGGVSLDVRIDDRTPPPADEALTFRILDGGIGYIAIHSFGSDDLVERFDRALGALRETRGLLIDVRNNGGGDTALARPIMGRFIEKRMQYAWMNRRDHEAMGPRWPEFVEPRGPFTYQKPVVVLVNHWSASMAEGFPMGMSAIHRATIVGTRMMGLGAGVIDSALGWSQINIQLSAEPVFHVDGTPRWHLRPDILVDLTQPTKDDDPILAAGIRKVTELRK